MTRSATLTGGVPPGGRRPAAPVASILLALPLVTMGCGKEDPAGEGARSPEEAVVFDVVSPPVFAIGVVEGRPEEQFQSIQALGVWGDSLVGVFDSGAREVRYFNLGGDFLGRSGGRGQGPGELMFPLWSWVETDGRIGVFDQNRHRVVVLGPSRTHEDLPVPIGAEVLPEPEPGTPPDVIWPRSRLGDSWLVSLGELRFPAPPGETIEPRESFVVVRDGEVQASAGIDLYSVVWYTTRAGDMIRMPLDLVPANVASANRGTVAVLDPRNARILTIDHGLEWREIPLARRCPGVPAVFLEDSDEGAERRGNIPLREFQEIVPECSGAYDRVALTGDRRVWVRMTPEAGGDTEGHVRWNVVDLAEGVLGVARLPRNFTPMDVAGGVLYGRWIDSLGVHYVHGYGLR